MYQYSSELIMPFSGASGIIGLTPTQQQHLGFLNFMDAVQDQLIGMCF